MTGKRSRGKASSQTDRTKTKLQPEETRRDLPDPAANHPGDGRAGTKPGATSNGQAALPVPDPYDPAAYRVDTDLNLASKVKPVLTNLPIQRPHKTWWVRRRPDPDYVFHVCVVEVTDDDNRTVEYLVPRHMHQHLVGEVAYVAKSFYLAVNTQGRPFLWWIRRPMNDTDAPDRWMVGPMEAIRLAATQWVRIFWQNGEWNYEPSDELDQEPRWPGISPSDVLRLAFQDRIIDSPNHKVLRQLRGKKVGP
jgi:hypothetical protein